MAGHIDLQEHGTLILHVGDDPEFRHIDSKLIPQYKNKGTWKKKRYGKVINMNKPCYAYDGKPLTSSGYKPSEKVARLIPFNS